MVEIHPRDKFITVYGRKPVLEAIMNTKIQVDKLLIAKNAKSEIIDRIIVIANKRKIPFKYIDSKNISQISRNGRQDQGIVIDIIAFKMKNLDSFLENLSLNSSSTLHFLAFDGITTPANIGLIIRSCVATGIDGVVLPRLGCPEISPLVIKASAGTAFQCPILRCENITIGLNKLKKAGFVLYWLSNSHKDNKNIITANISEHAIFVMGNETNGISTEITNLIDYWISIPMKNNIDSINVACAATIVCYEIMRRKEE